MKKKLPKFKSEEEEAHFWDTHSPLDYPGEFTEVKEPLKFSPELLKTKKRKFTSEEYTKLGALAAKEKGKEKRVTKRLINNLKKPPKFVVNK